MLPERRAVSAALADLRLRQILFLIVAAIFAGTIVELVLTEHTGEMAQLIPFFLCAAGLAATAAVLARPGRNTILVLRLVMILVAAGGLLGSSLHLAGNVAFAQEIRPNAAFIDTFFSGIKGANPLFAPGILVFAAAVAITATYYHPAASKR